MEQPAKKEKALKIIKELRKGNASAGPLDFRGVSLTDEDLSGLNLTGIDFTDADFTGADLSKCNLFKSKLKGASLLKAILREAELSGADLTGAYLEDADCCHIGLGMACLRNAKLFNAKLENSTLVKADLQGADLRCVSLKNARVREANLRHVDFTGANLQGADLSLSTVDQATFNNADLQEARLRMIKGYNSAKWIGVDIRNINFSGAYLLRRFVIDQNYLKEFRESGRFANIFYYLWWLTSDCGRSMARWCLCIALLALFFGGLFYLIGGIDYRGNSGFFSSFYYSIVTLTTLGYGDIVPVTTCARIIAIIEVATGYVMLGGLLSIFNNKLARRGD